MSALNKARPSSTTMTCNGWLERMSYLDNVTHEGILVRSTLTFAASMLRIDSTSRLTLARTCANASTTPAATIPSVYAGCGTS